MRVPKPPGLPIWNISRSGNRASARNLASVWLRLKKPVGSVTTEIVSCRDPSGGGVRWPFGWLELKAVRRSPRARFLRGEGGMRAVLMLGRPMKSTCWPLLVRVTNPPMILLGLFAGKRIRLLGISMMAAKVLTLGPKKLCACPGGRGDPGPVQSNVEDDP